MIRKTMILAALALLLGGAGPALAGPIIAYDNATVAPNQNFGNALGMDFNVNQAITINALGAFFGDNINNLTFQNPGGVTVGIYNRTTQTLVAPSVLIAPTAYNFIVNGDAFANVNYTLGPGQYSIVAFNDPNYNSFGGANGTSTTNDGGGLITFVGGSEYGFTDSYPTIPDGGPANRYDAGTFAFSSAAPEPASLTLLGISLAGLAGYGWRRRKLVVIAAV